MPKTILIAGGAGFLGSHLCDYYVDKGYRTICVDDLSTGFIKNIAHLRKRKNFEFIKHDICKPIPKKHYMDIKYDIVANLASPASPPQYQRLAIETLLVGSSGTFNMLGLAAAHKARYFHASTSEVYGDPLVHPQPESYRGSVNTYGPRSMYDESKRFGEALIYSYRQKYVVSTTIARFFNTYGPRMDPEDGRVVSNLIVQTLKGERLSIFGDGTQTRSFCYVDDLIEGVVKLIDSKEEGPMNLGNPKEYTIKELADMIQELVGTNIKLTHKPLPIDDPLQRKPVIKLAKDRLNWQPHTNLRDGLLKTIEYFRSNVRQIT